MFLCLFVILVAKQRQSVKIFLLCKEIYRVSSRNTAHRVLGNPCEITGIFYVIVTK